MLPSWQTCAVRAPNSTSATGRWRDLAPLPKGASHVGVAAMNGKIYVAGGFLANVHKDPQTSFADYDIASNTWRTATAPPGPW